MNINFAINQGSKILNLGLPYLVRQTLPKKQEKFLRKMHPLVQRVLQKLSLKTFERKIRGY